MKKSVACIAPTDEAALRIVDQARAAGFSPSDVSVLVADTTGTRKLVQEKGTKAPEGAAAGGSAGAVLGGALGWLVGIGALAIPGLGPFIAAGPLLAALSGAAVGAAAGGITGGLIGMGIPEYEAKVYEGKLKEGGSLIVLHCPDDDDVKQAKEIFENAGGTDISVIGASGAATRTSDDDRVVAVETLPRSPERARIV